MGLGLITCGEVEDVVSVLTLVRRGVAQVFHALRVELREQLEVEEEEEGKEDGQEEGEEVESGEGRVKQRQPPHTWMTWRWGERRSELEPWNVSVMIKDCETMRAGSVHVVMRHVIVGVQCANVVIGVHMVVLFVLLVVASVVPINFLVVML